MAAQVVTVTENAKEFLPVKSIKWDWLCTDAGVVVSATANKYTGMVTKIVIVPDGAPTAPTASYDMTVTDENGVDLLEGGGTDLSATDKKYLDQTDGLGNVCESTLTLNVTNAGNAKGGIVYAYLA